MSSWVGSNIGEVVEQWGYPSGERKFQDKTLYIWDETKTLASPSVTNITANTYGSTTYAQAVTSGGGTSRWNCQRILIVNPQEVVTSWQWKGNNCPFGEIMKYANWRKRTAQPSTTPK